MSLIFWALPLLTAFLRVNDGAQVDFAVYMHNSEDDSIVVNNGWKFMSYKNLTDYWDEFKTQYNSLPGITTLSSISGIGHCCFIFKDSDNSTYQAATISDSWVGIVPTSSPTSFNCSSTYSNGNYYLKPGWSIDAVQSLTDTISIEHSINTRCPTSTNLGLRFNLTLFYIHICISPIQTLYVGI